MPGTPFTCTSTGVATVSSTVAASAPVYIPETCTTGGVIEGYWLTGNFIRDIRPTSVITIEMTMAVIGLFMKVFDIINLAFWQI
jgi:hypothetical protein